jgi:hypothetical protein
MRAESLRSFKKFIDRQRLGNQYATIEELLKSMYSL